MVVRSGSGADAVSAACSHSLTQLISQPIMDAIKQVLVLLLFGPQKHIWFHQSLNLCCVYLEARICLQVCSACGSARASAWL